MNGASIYCWGFVIIILDSCFGICEYEVDSSSALHLPGISSPFTNLFSA